MLLLPSPAWRANENSCRIPGMPAVPKNRAYSDQPNAASVPIEMSVSMVAAPWRRFSHAARWNGHAPHTITGAASASEAHCQEVNCSAGIIAIAMTGTASTVLTRSRVRRELSSGSAGSVGAPAPSDSASATGGAGSTAE